MKKVLHIAGWYPNPWKSIEGIFVKEQYDVFSEVTDGHLINVQVRNGQKLFEYQYMRYSNSEEGYYILTKIKSNKIIEILTTFLLLWVLFKSNYKKYDLLHFHIAYPLLIHYFLWKKIIKLPVIISEHWTAYHFNFHIPLSTKKLDRMKNIFKQKIPLITVSIALLKDIQKFSNTKDFPSTIIPNIINKKYFHYRDSSSKNSISTFFIVNIWSEMKNPFPLLEGFAELSKGGESFHLRIGGYGPLLEEMKIFVQSNQFEDKVTFIGKMNKEEIAQEYSKSDAYLFSSKYETFSVVCAEALCCGTPLIGPRMSAVLEYTSLEDITIVEKNDANSWVNALNNFIKKKDTYNKQEISKKYTAYFSNETIKDKYKNFIQKNSK